MLGTANDPPNPHGALPGLSADILTCRYGIYVLIVEIIGATTVFLYGTNLLYDPVVEKPQEDPDNPGRPKVLRCWVLADPTPRCGSFMTCAPVLAQFCVLAICG